MSWSSLTQLQDLCQHLATALPLKHQVIGKDCYRQTPAKRITLYNPPLWIQQANEESELNGNSKSFRKCVLMEHAFDVMFKTRG
jgi:hypothetical protein